jgi:hypothetical protein
MACPGDWPDRWIKRRSLTSGKAKKLESKKEIVNSPQPPYSARKCPSFTMRYLKWDKRTSLLKAPDGLLPRRPHAGTEVLEAT